MPEEHPDLPEVAWSGPERVQLEQFLDYFRKVLRRKAEGLGHDDLHRPLPMSKLTLGGLIRHMTLVEDIWFADRLLGEPLEPWASAPWDDDHDWEFTTAPDFTPEQLLADFDAACERSRVTAATFDSLDAVLVKPNPLGHAVDLRWLFIHMIEEYARHCGHADLLREAIDGVTGD